jgi:hypothetical protein
MTADTAADAARGTTTNNDMDISVSKDSSEDDSKDEMSDDNKGTEDALFSAARDIQNRMSHHAGTAGMEDCHFHDFFWQKYFHCEYGVGYAYGEWSAPREEPPKASALGALFPKSVPKAEPGVFGCWCLHGRSQPKDNEKMGVAIYQKYC